MTEYVVVKSSIDGKWRVMLKEDAPYGICYSVSENIDDAIHDGVLFLGIDPADIEVL